LVLRSLSVKEACQLLDVPGTWPEETVRNMWTWNQGRPPTTTGRVPSAELKVVGERKVEADIGETCSGLKGS
jgi:hypothetical protein